MLKEVVPFGLAIYGNGWDRKGAEELLPFWRGIVPLEDIPSLYSSAKVTGLCPATHVRFDANAVPTKSLR